MWMQRQANKYGAKKTIFKDRKYDSKLEAGVAQEIDLLEKAGEVIKTEPQKTFPLFGQNGKQICSHRVDFLLTFKDGHQEAWEAKGIAFPIWALKRKLFEDNYPEITYIVITAKNPNWWIRKNINR